MIKFSAAQPIIRPGAVKKNAEAIIKLYRTACDCGADIVVMPELCLSGATCGDLFLQSALLCSAAKRLDEIIAETAGKETILVFGLPLIIGKVVSNCAVSIRDGKLIGFTVKKNLSPAEKRWFSYSDEAMLMGAGECEYIEAFGVRMQVIIGEMTDGSSGFHVILNLSADKEIIRTGHINPGAYPGVYLKANAGFGESTTDHVYSGGSFISENGVVKTRIEKFMRNDTIIFAEIDEKKVVTSEEHSVNICEKPLPLQQNMFVSEFLNLEDRNEILERILNIQTTALATRLLHSASVKAVLGLSGGLDSALALLVCMRVMKFLEWEDRRMIAVIMPGFGTSGKTAGNAALIAKESGAEVREISIIPACKQHFADIGHSGEPKGYAFENTQARERTQILFDIANMENGIVVGTGDMTELALGFATYNGDHMSGYGVNAGIPKTIIRELVTYEAAYNEGLSARMKDSLISVVDTPISPELLPTDENGNISQITESIVGSYELNDYFMFHILKNRRPSEIVALAVTAFGGEYTEDILRERLRDFCKRFVTQQFKRSCLPDAPQIFELSLSPRGGLSLPSDADYTFFEEEIL